MRHHVEDAFVVHGITDNQHKMLEIRMALPQEELALTAHLPTGHTVQDYEKLTTYLPKYGSRSDVQKLRAIVARRPIGDKSQTEHLHALRLKFGTKPKTLTLLRHIFKDSLASHIAALLASEKLRISTHTLTGQMNYMSCTSPMLKLQSPRLPPLKYRSAIMGCCRPSRPSQLKSPHSLTDINIIKACSANKGAQHYPDNYEANAVSQQPPTDNLHDPIISLSLRPLPSGSLPLHISSLLFLSTRRPELGQFGGPNPMQRASSRGHLINFQIQFNKLYSEINITENIKIFLQLLHDHD